VGDGCELSRANNTALCWWDWRRQTFTGPGCVLADTLQCMCTHLTDFQAGMNMGTGELKVPDVAVIDPGAMTSLSLADVMASGRLLTVVGTLIGAAVTGFILSNFLHNRKRIQILRSLVFSEGRPAKDSLWFKELHGGVWTWNMDDEVEPDDDHAHQTIQTVRAMWDDFKTKKQSEVIMERRKSMRSSVRAQLVTNNPLVRPPLLTVFPCRRCGPSLALRADVRTLRGASLWTCRPRIRPRTRPRMGSSQCRRRCSRLSCRS
jgi:hypothetical protein